MSKISEESFKIFEEEANRRANKAWDEYVVKYKSAAFTQTEKEFFLFGFVCGATDCIESMHTSLVDMNQLIKASRELEEIPEEELN